MTNIDWHEHARLVYFRQRKDRLLAAGELHAVVDVALLLGDEIEILAIETDGGQIFCHHEIEYIALLASKPGRAGVKVK